MFTGIIQAVGKVSALTPTRGDVEIHINTADLDLGDVSLGDSIAVNGVCLTAVKLAAQGFIADVSAETLHKTTLASLTVGSAVNLEKALRATDRLGGHLVSGHVDGVGSVCEREQDARSVRFTLEAPQSLAKYIAQKGSICLDGTSLTVNSVQANRFTVNIVPHTLSATIMDRYQPGTKLNIEVDLIARYLERLLNCTGETNDDAAVGISKQLLQQHGFMKSEVNK